MSGFSFAAPEISKEDEQRERDLLSEDERQEIKNDIYGLSVELKDETEEMRQSASCLMQRAFNYDHTNLLLLLARFKELFMVFRKR
jgi:hypothetical protein